MAVDSTHSSIIWDSTNSPLRFQSSSLSNIPNNYDCSLVTPVTLAQRKHRSPSESLQLPPLKFRSTLTWSSSEEEKLISKSITSSEQELFLLKQNFDRIRASLSQSVALNRHALDKANYKKASTQQTLNERDQLINELLTASLTLNDKLNELKDEVINQRRTRDSQELRQLKLRRTLKHLNQTKNKPVELFIIDEKEKIIEQYNSRISQLKDQYQMEIADRDKQLENLKKELSEEYNRQTNEYMKILRTAEEAFYSESEKRDILQNYIDDYEANVYRAKKPCCIETLRRLNKATTQYRLYLIIELALHELFHSSCSCGRFQRAYKAFLQSHKQQL